MTLVRRALWSFTILILFIALFAWWLLGTQSGLQWAVNLAPDTLQVKSIDGDVSDLSFTQLTYTSGETTLRIDQGSLRWSPLGLLSRRALIDNLRLNEVLLELPQSTSSEKPYSAWQGTDLPIDIAIGKAAITRLSVSQREQPALLTQARINISGELVSNVLDLDEFTLTDSDKMVSMQGSVDLSASSAGVVDLIHSVNLELEETSVVSQGTIKGTWSLLNLEHKLSSPFPASFNANISDLLTERIAWNAVLKTEQLNQHTVMGETLSLGAGQFDFDGESLPTQGLSGLTARLVGQVSGGNSQLSQWQLDTDISINGNDLTIDMLRLDQFGQGQPAGLIVKGRIDKVLSFVDLADDSGTIEIAGNWSSLSWPLNATNKTNAKTDSALINSDGRFTLNGTSLNYAVLAAASGRFQGRPVDAEVDVLLAGSSINVRKLRLKSGESVVNAKGVIDELIDLSWSFESPNIGDFLADGEGPLSSTGRLRGDRAKPKVELQAASIGLSFSGYSAKQLNLSAKVSLSDINDVMDIKLQANALQDNQSTVIDSIDVTVNGLLKSHTVEINSTLANQAKLVSKAQGALIENEWLGTLTTLSFDDPLTSLWALQKGVELQVAENTFSISQSCLINQAQSVCFDAYKTIDGTQLNAELKDLDLANFNPLLQLYDLSLAGQAVGNFSYVKESQQLAGKIDGYLESTSPIITWQETGDEELPDEALTFETVRIDIKQDPNLQGTVGINLSNSDSVKVEFAINAPIESPDFMQAATQGKANVTIDDLSILPTALLNTVSLNGELKADIQLAGTLAVPEFIASAAVINANVDIPELGLQLEDVAFNVDSDGTSKIGLNGQFRSGSGSLKLSGNVDFTNLKAPEIILALNGDDLQLANTSELNIVGDLDLAASFSDELFELQGDIVIDKAELDYKIPETALFVSNDVILLGVENQEVSLKQRLKLNVDLGKQTHIRAQGLDADLLGNLKVFQEPGGILRGSGQISVNNGRYRAYGQDLKIDQGRLIFSGGSIADPSLNLKAEKLIESITAGVSVTGRASSPKLNLYSAPSMPDEDILSVLIFNKPVGDLGSQDGFTLLRIANSLRGDGTSDVTKMTDKLQESLGLTNLELQLTNNAPSIVAGKQLSSKFYIGYGYGLLDAAQSLILRYNLSKAWSIKADLGADSGADLRYQLER